jgi:hypothetical protein
MGWVRKLTGTWVAIAAVAVASLLSPVSAATFTFENNGGVGPTVIVGNPPGSPVTAPRPCPMPPALPINCDLTALGNATVTSGDMVGPWLFSSVFSIADSFQVTGWFSFFDPTPAGNSFSGTLSGAFNPAVFQSAFDYVVTGGSGAFAIGRGLGSGIVQVFPTSSGFGYFEQGQFTVPEPGTLALMLSALLCLRVMRRRGRR